MHQPLLRSPLPPGLPHLLVHLWAWLHPNQHMLSLRPRLNLHQHLRPRQHLLLHMLPHQRAQLWLWLWLLSRAHALPALCPLMSHHGAKGALTEEPVEAVLLAALVLAPAVAAAPLHLVRPLAAVVVLAVAVAATPPTPSDCTGVMISIPAAAAEQASEG